MLQHDTKTFDLCLQDLKLELILQGGFFHTDMALTRYLHFHAAYELHYLESGTLEMDCAGHTHLLTPGDFLIIAPNVSHRMLSCSQTIRKISLQCTFSPLSSTEKGLFALLGGFFSQIESSRILRFPCRYFSDISNLLSQNPISQTNLLRLKMLLSLVFLDLSEYVAHEDRPLQDSADDCDDDLVLRPVHIYDYLSSYFRQPITAQDLADELNISKRQLFRFLREKMNTEFLTLLAQQRIAYAIQLMRDNVPAKEAAFLCGYQSANGFAHAFRKITGQTVTEFRNKEFSLPDSSDQ